LALSIIAIPTALIGGLWWRWRRCLREAEANSRTHARVHDSLLGTAGIPSGMSFAL
jgi:hypothetical protein